MSDEDPFDGLDEPEVPLAERARLNAVDSYAKGTFAGAATLGALKNRADSEALGDIGAQVGRAATGKQDTVEKSVTPATDALDKIRLDLARYETMRSFDGPLEAVVSGAAHLGAGLLSPESWVTKVPGVDRLIGPLLGRLSGTVASRTIEAGASQAVVAAGTDPAVQAMSITSGAQEGFDPARFALSAPTGFVLGGALHGAGEAGSALLARRSQVAASERARIDQYITSRDRELAGVRTEPVPEGATELPAIEVAPPTAEVAPPPEAEALRNWTPDVAASEGPKPLDLSTFIARNGGLPLDGEAKALDLGRTFVPGGGPLARKNGRSIDGFWRERLVEAGYLPSDDAAGGVQRDVKNEIYDLLSRERAGEKHYSEFDRDRIPTREDLGPSESDIAVAEVRDQIRSELKSSGMREADFHPSEIHDAAELVYSKRFDDPLDALEHVVMQRAAADPVGPRVEDNYPGFERETAQPAAKPKFGSMDELLADSRRIVAQREARSGEIATALDGTGRARSKNAQGQDVVITRAAQDGGRFQVTTLEKGEPVGHVLFDDAKQAAVFVARNEPRTPTSETRPIAARGVRDETVSSGQGGDRPGQAGDPAGSGGVVPRAEPGEIQFRKRGGTGGPVDTVKPPGERAPTDPVKSLQDQSIAFAEAIDLPLRQGRLSGGKDVVGQYDTGQGVARVRTIPDFEAVAHEAGHAIEQKVGPDLTALLTKHAAELGPMDYEAGRNSVAEGFGVWMERYLTAPMSAATEAPEFTAAFREFMSAREPGILDAIDSAQAAHENWINAPTDAKLDAIVKTQEPDSVLKTIREEGMPATVSLAISKTYEGLFDDKAPVVNAVRDLARMIRDSTGQAPRLEGSDNPEALVRLFARSQQAGIRDMMDGVRPYHQVAPEGPSLRDAIIHATNPGVVDRATGSWDSAAVKEFSNYIVARRAEVLWAKYDAGELPNRPLAMSKADVQNALFEAEAANPTFREASEMIHGYTRQLLRKQFEGGLIGRELHDKLQTESFYVPFYRVMDDKPLSAGQPTSGASRSEGPGTANLIKQIKGSDRDIVDPIQSLMTQTFLVNRTLAHNDILKSFVSLARQARESGAVGVGRILEEIPATQMIGKKFDLGETVRATARKSGVSEDDTALLVGALTDTFGHDPIMGSIFHSEPAGKRGEPILFYKEGGEMRAVRLISKEEGTALYESLAEMPAQMRDIAVNIGAASATALRLGITTNPVFALTNFVRDQLGAAILRPDFIPFNPKGLIREAVQGLNPDGTAVKVLESIPGLKGVRTDNIAQLYNYAGGVSPGAGSAGLHDLQNRSIEALARKGWAVQKVGALRELVTKGNLLEGFKAIGETVEIAEAGTRLNVMSSVYKQKVRQGLSEYDAMIEAAYQATDLMDFGRHGSGTQVIRAIVPFMNAHLQGINKFYRTLSRPLQRAAIGDVVTAGERSEILNAGIGLTKFAAVGGGLGYYYGLFSSTHEAYRDSNDDLRATHLIIPGGAFGMPGKVIVVPKPFELAMGFNLGELLGQRAATGDPRVAGFAMSGLQELLIPPNVLNSIPIVKTYAELALNKSFFTKREIVPSTLQRLVPEEQVGPKTSSLAKTVGKALGVSPIKVDYAVGATFGMWGKDLLAASNAANPDAPDAALEDSMFLRRFIKNADAGSETTKHFWDLAAQQNGKYAQAKATYEDKLQSFKDADAASFLSSLAKPERAYVTLNSAADEDTGKQKYTVDERRLHPLTRGAQAVQVTNAYVKELTVNAQRELGTGEKVDMDPTTRRRVIDNLRILSGMEQRNALVIAKEPGYDGRTLMSTTDQLNVIRAISPAVADELATRYATAKVPSTEAVAKAWPEAMRRLMTDGGQADLRGLASDVKAEGYEFGGERVRKAPRRRVPIPATPTP